MTYFVSVTDSEFMFLVCSCGQAVSSNLWIVGLGVLLVHLVLKTVVKASSVYLFVCIFMNLPVTSDVYKLHCSYLVNQF